MTSLFYDNRRLLVLVIALIAVAGLSSFYLLPRMEDPVLTQRVAVINTRFPGAKADRVEALVTEPIEEELEEISEIKELRSTSRAGISTITVELRDDVYESEEIWSRVRDKIDDAEPLLPAGVLEPDFDQLEVTAYAQVVALVWQLPEPANYAVLRRNAEELEQRLRAVSGTREVDTFGDPAEEITVSIRQAELATLGLSVADVARQIEASDSKIAAGLLRQSDSALLLEVDGELNSLERIEATPIRYGAAMGAGSTPGGGAAFVSLGDIADVEKGIIDPPRSLAIVDDKPAIAIGALVRADKRIDHWAQDAAETITQFQESLPPAITLRTVFEQSPYVETRLSTLLSNLLVGAGAVMLVIWVMMGWRSAMVVGAALPLASLMVLAGMRTLGIPIHQMSVTGLIIALGLLIDNAIVIVDEIRGRLNEGMERGDAVSKSVRHLAAPLFGSTLTTILSFAPIALMPGPAGEFVGSIALSVILAVGSSFLLAMTVTPSIAAIFAGKANETARRQHWWSNGLHLPRVTEGYRWVLGGMFRRPLLGVGLGAVLPIAGFIGATTLTEQFFPPADRDQFQIQVELPAHTPLERTQQLVNDASRLIKQGEHVTAVDWFLGESAPSFYYNMMANREGVPQYAQAIVQLDTAEDSEQIIRQVQLQLDAALPEARFLVRQLEQGPPFEAPIEVRLFGPDLHVLQDLGATVRRVLAETPDVLHTVSDLSEALPKLSVAVDESEARLAGLDHRAIAQQLDNTLEGAVGGSLLEATEDLPVRVRVSDQLRGDISEVSSLALSPPGMQGAASNQAAAHLPLSALAKINLVPEIAAIPHFNSERMNEVRAYITAGVLPAQVLGDFQERLAAAGLEMPPGYRLQYGGEADKRDQAVGNLMSNVGLLMVLMVATLVMAFGSFRMAGLIGAVGLLSIGLGMGALAVAGYPFGFMAIVGSMGLAGVAINDSIVVLAALREDEKARTGDPDAVRDVVVKSSRHVFSTTLTTIAGFLPLLLAGGGFWPPLATTISGGVAGATLIALSLVPAGYVLLMCQSCKQSQQSGEDRRGDELREPTEATAEDTDVEIEAPVLVAHTRVPLRAITGG
ncbi:MAG: efflux RND transporter permease subunit [Planctomycetota bacterium]